MERLLINGGRKLFGSVQVDASKNAFLPMLAATVLCDGQIFFENYCNLSDLVCCRKILSELGVESCVIGKGLLVDSRAAHEAKIASDLARQVRASVLFLGPVLGRFGKAVLAHPGGCKIGARPIDIHIKAFKQLGAKIVQRHGYIYCNGQNLQSGKVILDFPSVGATENLMMCACLLHGQTVIKNAAKEPEIVDLQNFLNAMGGCVRGAGTDCIEVVGVGEGVPVREDVAAGESVGVGEGVPVREDVAAGESVGVGEGKNFLEQAKEKKVAERGENSTIVGKDENLAEVEKISAEWKCGKLNSVRGSENFLGRTRGEKIALHGGNYRVMPDRIVAGTYLLAAAICGGDVTVLGARAEDNESLLAFLRQSACKIDVQSDRIRIRVDKRLSCADKIQTLPYPYFPTDLQPQMMVLQSVSKGVCLIEENLFENRFGIVPELVKMGADVAVNGRTALVKGTERLFGAEVFATDLRAGAALVLAGLKAEGYTTIFNVHYIDRGYDKIEEKFSQLGADIRRVDD